MEKIDGKYSMNQLTPIKNEEELKELYNLTKGVPVFLRYYSENYPGELLLQGDKPITKTKRTLPIHFLNKVSFFDEYKELKEKYDHKRPESVFSYYIFKKNEKEDDAFTILIFHSHNKTKEDADNRNALKIDGGKKQKRSILYKGKSYKVHIGTRGGEYILVGMDKKKVYV